MVDKIKKYERKWTCNYCKYGIGEEEDNNSEVVRDLPKTCRCCEKRIRKGADFLMCTDCRGQWHKQEDCSRLSKETVRKLNRETWKCDGCQGINANPKQGPEINNPSFFGKSTSFRSKIDILQWMRTA